jgi:hypothetical protein
MSLIQECEMDILPAYFSVNTYGIMTNSEIESLYYATIKSQKSYNMNSYSNDRIDCTVDIEVEKDKKVNSIVV